MREGSDYSDYYTKLEQHIISGDFFQLESSYMGHFEAMEFAGGAFLKVKCQLSQIGAISSNAIFRRKTTISGKNSERCRDFNIICPK